LKSNPTKMMSPAFVLWGKERDRELVFCDDTLATCTNDMEELVEFDWMVSVKVAVPVPALLVALSVTVEVPAAVGVPEIKPVAVLTDKPEGNPAAP
jgi:hypothetical protein